MNKGKRSVQPPVQSIWEIKNGKLTQGQVDIVMGNIENTFSNNKHEWRAWKNENDPYNKAFEQAIKDRLGKDTIVGYRLFAKVGGHFNNYYVIGTDGKVYIVRAGFNAEGKPNIGVMMDIPNIL